MSEAARIPAFVRLPGAIYHEDGFNLETPENLRERDVGLFRHHECERQSRARAGPGCSNNSRGALYDLGRVS